MIGRMRLVAVASTLAIFLLIPRRVPVAPLLAAFRDADYVTFLLLMVPNTVFYFCWDTLVLTTVVRWFHAGVSYREILPVRAASYVVGFFNTNAGRGAVAAYLWRRLDAPFLELGSTVIFLVLTEYTQLVLWAMLGIFIPFGKMLTFLPVIFMAAALPVTVAHLGTTQAAWLFFFGQYAPAPRLLAFSLAAHLTFTLTRALLGVAWLPVAYHDLVTAH